MDCSLRSPVNVSGIAFCGQLEFDDDSRMHFIYVFIYLFVCLNFKPAAAEDENIAFQLTGIEQQLK